MSDEAVRKIVSNEKRNKELAERVEKLEFCLLLIINQLRNIEGMPQLFLDNIEKIISQQGK